MKSKANPKVDWYFEKADPWKREVTKLRAITLASGLTEVLKWGQPCYALDGQNVVVIQTFKQYCAYLFFKGALLKDPKSSSDGWTNSRSCRRRSTA